MAEVKHSRHCPYTSTHKWKGITPYKKFVFLTRVTRIENVQKIKDHLYKVFSEVLSVDYQHILLPDLTVANKKEDFEQFVDEKTRLYFIQQKEPNDKYAAFNLDKCIQTIPKDQDCWIYVLDDDNKLADNFAQLAQECNVEEPVVVFNIKMQKIKNGFDGTIKPPLQYKKTLFHIDIANYIVHRSVFEQARFGNNIKSQWCDGIFIQKVLYYQYLIHYVNKCYSYHNGL